jgi:hypothetical protein
VVVVLHVDGGLLDRGVAGEVRADQVPYQGQSYSVSEAAWPPA